MFKKFQKSRCILVHRSQTGCVGINFSWWLALALSGPLYGQSISGEVVGTVKDPSGNVVPVAHIELKNKGTDAVRATVTNDTGSYQFSNVDIGTYVLTVEAPGFQKSEFTAFDLGAREVKRLDADLKVASQSTTVNVESSAGAVIQTENSSVSETKTGRELVDLPVAIATRGTGSTSPMSTLTAQPGVQMDAAGGVSVAGALPTQLSITIDGLSVVGARTDGPLTELFPSFNAIEEIRVGETINPAEFGGIADITTISKSGTNSYHGGAFENLQNSYLNAGNTFSHTTPPLKMNDFGFFIGGPVTVPKLYSGHDKTFFFASYEGLQLPRSVLLVESVPSVAMRSGDLSAYSGSGILTGFPGNVIPTSQISALSAKAMQYLFPLPNYGAPGAISNNYLASFGEPIKSNQADLRVDHNISQKQQAYVRMTYKNRRVQNTPTGSALLGPFSQPEIDYAMTAAYNYVFTPTLINELRGGFSGNHYATSYGITASAAASELGITDLLPGTVPKGNAPVTAWPLARAATPAVPSGAAPTVVGVCSVTTTGGVRPDAAATRDSVNRVGEPSGAYYGNPKLGVQIAMATPGLCPELSRLDTFGHGPAPGPGRVRHLRHTRPGRRRGSDSTV